ncbi:DksA C4-type domain-containing protein OS=Streptomyces griseomycini OX=66895 GN=FHS37_006650 PE=4 SV=1 [Streptomyces griseomycini]
MTLHCQVDAIGPSDRHPDLVKLEVSFPPVQAPPVQAPPVMRAPLIGQPIQEIRLVCGTCGLVPVEEHPRILDVLRCVNCKEHLGVGRFEGST